jgi:adenine-specific DNA methylase
MFRNCLTLSSETIQSDWVTNELLAPESIAWEQSEAEKGQVYTRPEVVEFMLTAIGLNEDEDFKHIRILEPSCGEGEFVVAIVKRLLSCQQKRLSVNELATKLLAVDLVTQSTEVAKQSVVKILEGKGYSKIEIDFLINQWFLSADFLLADISPNFTHVIGNPPYVRVENIPKKLLKEYRRRFATMADRADLYIPFYEKCLSLLIDEGRLSFICTDRWTKNTYGRSLRKFINDKFGLEMFVDLYGINAFEKDVMTYPAITQIKKGKCQKTVLKNATDFSTEEALEAFKAISGESTNLTMRKSIVNDDKPWLFGAVEQLDLIDEIEKKFPLLESIGCKVFIGAATGANKIFIVDSSYSDSQIEADRLLPVVTANDLSGGVIKWRNKYLINTYNKTGLVNLEDYPRLSGYLHSNKEVLCKRHIAKKDRSNWYKTIDRVYEERVKKEKLLIPDISNNPIVLYDSGRYYPNNSIYYICSDNWNLHALRVILLSSVTRLFIATYSTKIAKGYLRYQAQHLRKLRLPRWESLSEELQHDLEAAGRHENYDLFNKLTFEVYQLSDKEKLIIGR